MLAKYANITKNYNVIIRQKTGNVNKIRKNNQERCTKLVRKQEMLTKYANITKNYQVSR